MVNPTGITTGALSPPATAAVTENNSETFRESCSLFRRLQRSVNSALRCLQPACADVQQGWTQALALGLTTACDSAAFVAGLRQRLQHPDALALLVVPPEAATRPARWLPLPVQPLLNDKQTLALMALALNLPPQKMTALSKQAPALYEVLVDEVNKFAARQQAYAFRLLLPHMLRLPAVSQALLRLHPLLPLCLWTLQLLWRIQQQGLMNAADEELKRLLHQQLLALDGDSIPSAGLPCALSDQLLWRQLNRWVEQRLPLLSEAQPAADQPAVLPAPLTIPLPVRDIPGWQLNSALNHAADKNAALLIRIDSCYELLQQQTQAVDIAIGCFPAHTNQTHSPAELEGLQLARSLVMDDSGNMYTRWQLESADAPLWLQGLTLRAQARPLALRELAGPDDHITLFDAQPGGEAEPLARTLVAWTQQQLATPPAADMPLQEVKAVTNQPTVVALVSKLLARVLEYGQHLLPVAGGGVSWSFPAVSATAPAALPPEPVSASDTLARVSVEDFIDSLWFKYPDQLARYSQVIVTQTRNRMPRDSEDRQMSLSQALTMMEETESHYPELLLNFHPGWHKNLADDIHDYLRGKLLPVYNASAPVDWNSTENQQAAWQIGMGVGRKSVEDMIGIVSEINSEVNYAIFSVERWIQDKFRILATACGVDVKAILLETPVKIFVTMPASHSRQHIPINRELDGTRQQVTKPGGRLYTLKDILTSEYKRGPIRAESLTVEFPAGISHELQQAILSIDLQSQYINELDAELAKPAVKKGMVRLFKTILNNTLLRLEKAYQAQRSAAEAAQLSTAIQQGEIYLLNWFGYTLHNLVFIKTEGDTIQKGIILSLWDTELVHYAVKIDQLSSIAFEQGKKAQALLALLDKSLPIEGRMYAFNKAGIYDNQIIINTSGRYDIALHGKVFIKKNWRPPDKAKCLLSLMKPQSAENEMLTHFVDTLKKDMNYLVLTREEHLIGTAIEVLTIICTLLNLFTVSTAITSASGGSGMTAKVLSGISSWQANFGLSLTLNILPMLIKANLSDRREEREKAWIEAMLNLAGEGISFLLTQQGGKVLRGLIHQGGRAISIPYRQLPGAFTHKVSDYAKRYFLSYRNIILRAVGVPESIPVIDDNYAFPFIDIKAPAPLADIKDAVSDFSRFVSSQVSDINEVRAIFASRNTILIWLQRMFESRGARSEIGVVISWQDFHHAQPEVYYVLRINSPAPDVLSSFSETENVLVDPYIHDGKINHLIGAEDAWLSDMPAQAPFRNKAIAVKWFDNMAQAQSWSRALIYGRTGSIRMFSRQMLARPDWYLRDVAAEVLKDLERRQSSALREIYARENDIALEPVKVYGNHNAHPQLSYLYTSTSILTIDMLAEKYEYLARKNISAEAAPLPAGDFRVIPTELRGISTDNQGNITVTNYAASAEQLINHQLQTFSTSEMTPAARQAVYSCLYSLAADKALPRQKRQIFNQAYVQKLNRIKANTAWLQYDAQKIRVPLLMVVDRSKLNTSDIGADNHITATFPAAAIRFVLTLDDRNQTISDILAPHMAMALDVRPLVIRDKPQWCKTRDLAWRYVMIPELENLRLELSGKEHEPWRPIIDLQATGGLIDFATSQRLRDSTRTDDYRDFLGDQPVRIENRSQLSQIQPGARLAFCDRAAGPGEPPLSHALMLLEEGKAIGAHNQLLGGNSGWEIIWLQAGNWTNDRQHGFVLTVNDHHYSLHVQTSPAPLPPVTADGLALNKEAVTVIAMAEQYIVQPAAMMGVTSAWEEVLGLYRQAGLINRRHFDQLRKNVSETNFQPFLGAGAQLARSREEMLLAAPGSRLIFIEPAAQPGVPRMVHAMVVTAWGQAVGVNNQPVGGKAGWGKIDLAGLAVNADCRHGLVIEHAPRRLQCIIAPALTDALFTRSTKQD